MVADKNSNLITSVTKIMLLQLYRRIFRTLAYSQNSLFNLIMHIQGYSYTQGHSGIFGHVQAY